MKGNIFKIMGILAGVVLLIVLFNPIRNLIGKYYFQSPTIIIIIVVGIIVVVYLIVFFKEIFLKRKGR